MGSLDVFELFFVGFELLAGVGKLFLADFVEIEGLAGHVSDEGVELGAVVTELLPQLFVFTAKSLQNRGERGGFASGFARRLHYRVYQTGM